MEEKDFCSQNFQKELMYMEYHDPPRFVYPPWLKQRRIPVLYLIYRLILWVYFIATYIWGANKHFRGGRFFIYLTNWSYTVLVAYMLTAGYLVLRQFIRERRTEDSNSSLQCLTMPISYKVNWFLFNVATCSAIFVSSLYWTFVYAYVVVPEPIDMDVVYHILNCIFAISEVFIAGLPVRLLHMIHPLIYSVVYNFFNMVYTLAGGTNHLGQPYIYLFWDWRVPLPALAFSLGFPTALIIFFVFIWILARFRGRVGRRLGMYHTTSRFQIERPSNGEFNKSYGKDVV